MESKGVMSATDCSDKRPMTAVDSTGESWTALIVRAGRVPMTRLLSHVSGTMAPVGKPGWLGRRDLCVHSASSLVFSMFCDVLKEKLSSSIGALASVVGPNCECKNENVARQLKKLTWGVVYPIVEQAPWRVQQKRLEDAAVGVGGWLARAYLE